MKTEDDKYYPQIYLEERRYKKRNPWKRGETSKSDEGDDESTK